MHFPDFSYYSRQYSDSINNIYTSLISHSQYIPVSALKTSTVLTKGEHKNMLYSFKDFKYAMGASSIGKIKEFCERFGTNIRADYLFTLRHNSMPKGFHALGNTTLYHHDEVTDTFTILMEICLRREFVFTVNRESPDISQFVIVVDRKFITNPEFFKLYRNIKKGFLDRVETTMDILYTNNLMGLCYNTKIITAPKFNTITEMIEFNKSFNKVLVPYEPKPEPIEEPELETVEEEEVVAPTTSTISTTDSRLFQAVSRLHNTTIEPIPAVTEETDEATSSRIDEYMRLEEESRGINQPTDLHQANAQAEVEERGREIHLNVQAIPQISFNNVTLRDNEGGSRLYYTGIDTIDF